MPEIPESPRTRIRRGDRTGRDLTAVFAVLDATPIAHVGAVDAEGHPFVVPLLHARDGDDLLLHGSPASRFFRVLRRGVDVAVTATVMDGLVLARSAVDHSANYRSAMLFGRTEEVRGLEERRRALDLLTDRLVPGRRPFLRPMTDKEVRGTSVIRVPISDGSVKVRTGPPVDEDDDYDLPIWAGVLPYRTSVGPPEPDPRNLPGLEVPEHVTRLTRP